MNCDSLPIIVTIGLTVFSLAIIYVIWKTVNDLIRDIAEDVAISVYGSENNRLLAAVTKELNEIRVRIESVEKKS